MTTPLTRRQMLQTTAIATGLTLLPGPLRADDAPRSRQRRVRIAHLTDTHIQPERGAVQGVIAALHHAQGLTDPPELIISGGDTIMDALAVSRDRTKLQWELWQQVIRDECSLPVESCLGNHDVFGWDKQASGTTGQEAEWGKRWACEVFGRDKTYGSFDRAGWHFVMLDSIAPHEQRVYEGRLDDEQFAWLQADLAAAPATMPVLVVSHIPIVSATVLAGNPKQNADRDFVIPSQLMHSDLPRLRDLFWKYKNVKLCLSGHIHLVDRVDFDGVTYLCNGAVSGAWWKGDHRHTKAGYGLVDLYDDGTFQHQYVDYGWRHQA